MNRSCSRQAETRVACPCPFLTPPDFLKSLYTRKKLTIQANFQNQLRILGKLH